MGKCRLSWSDRVGEMTGGRKRVLVWLCWLGGVGAVLGFVLPLGCARIEELGQLSYMTEQARQIYIGSILYAEDHGGRWPGTVGDLVDAEIFYEDHMTIPSRVDAGREGEPMYRILVAGRDGGTIGESEPVIVSTVAVRPRRGAKWVVVLGNGDAHRVSRKELERMGVNVGK